MYSCCSNTVITSLCFAQTQGTIKQKAMTGDVLTNLNDIGNDGKDVGQRIGDGAFQADEGSANNVDPRNEKKSASAVHSLPLIINYLFLIKKIDAGSFFY